MMTFIFVVCYGFLAFATAAYTHGACIKAGNTNRYGYKSVLAFFSLIWPVFWIIILVVAVCHYIGRGINFCGEKIAKHL